ncbi:MAG: sulfurtransferase TusA family protein [Nitrospirota bacterium]|nr:MAG: sulfurtransferase TusA family protein [Nitrospirota bacterium]
MAKTELDFRGMSCPMPIMKTAMAFKKATSGDVFTIMCDDPGFEPDIKAWASETGNVLDSIEKKDKDIIATVTKK